MHLQRFSFNGSEIREITDEAGNPWFVAKDICSILDLEPRDSIRYLDDDEKSNVPSKHIGQNGGRNPLIINESGLYSLILRSRKPEAKAIKKWVTSEVLPSIRKTGKYSVSNSDMSNDEIVMKALEIQQEKIRKLSIKAQVAEELAGTKGLYLLTEAGKMIMGKPNVFCQWLVDSKIMYRKGSHHTLVPYSPYNRKEKGYFEVKMSRYKDHSVSQTYITAKGILWIQEKYLKKEGLLMIDYTTGISED